MKGFLKENTGVLASILLAAAMLAIFQFVSCGKSDDVEKALIEVNDLKEKLATARRAQEGFEGLEGNLQLARKDKDNLLEERVQELKKWKKILGREKPFSAVAKKTPDEINAEISRFLDRYRNEARTQGVTIRGTSISPEKATDNFPGIGIPAVKDREGFGFSGYDGTWPNITDEEARELLTQKIILEKLLTALFKARPEEEPLNLLGVRREPVGEVDRRVTANETLAVEPLVSALAKRKGRIETYAFEVSFEARTHALRTFLNTLKHPFLIRNVSVQRTEDAATKFSNASPPGIETPFGPEGAKNSKTQRLPIIEDVGSRFVVLVEYVLSAHADPVAFLQSYYSEGPPPETLLADFLKASGSKGTLGDLVKTAYPKQEKPPNK